MTCVMSAVIHDSETDRTTSAYRDEADMKDVLYVLERQNNNLGRKWELNQ